MRSVLLLVLPLLAAGARAGEEGVHFVDPSASLSRPEAVELGELTYVGPFAVLRPGAGPEHGIVVGAESDLQDNARVVARRGGVELGDKALVAHGARIRGPARVGVGGSCPEGGEHCPSFLSFNALLDGGEVEMDAMVSALARVGPGVVIPSGRRVLPGADVASQELVEAKTVAVTEADRLFMQGVLEVNVCFAQAYHDLAQQDASNVTGINYDADCAFNPGLQLPTLAGETVREPGFRNRILGDVRLADTLQQLDRRMGRRVSLRADEGSPFTIGAGARFGTRTTFHALEHTTVTVGDGGRFGPGSIVHGGPTDAGGTVAGDDLRLGAGAVLFRSVVGDGVRLGARSLVQQSTLPDGAVVPARTILISDEVVGQVEW